MMMMMMMMMMIPQYVGNTNSSRLEKRPVSPCNSGEKGGKMLIFTNMRLMVGLSQSITVSVLYTEK